MKKVEIDEILLPGDETDQKTRAQEVRGKFWEKAKIAANRIPFMDEVIACYYCALDPETPPKVRGILLAALAYFILPLDSIPDFLIGFGLTDDIAVLTAAYTAVKSHITESHREAAREKLKE